MDTTLLLDREKDRFENIIRQLKVLRSELNQDQLSWKPNPKRWSIIECVEHINTACRHYIPEIKKQVEKGSSKPFARDFKPGLLGNYLAKMMEPKPDGFIPGKMKTLKKFEPRNAKSKSTLDPKKVFDECIEHHKRFLDLIERSRHLDINKVRVVSAIGPIIRFKLGDCFRFNTAHHLRHLLQADNVKNDPRFPNS
ncbi:MAG: DinB family protein [Bacteroidota bacterium]